MMAPQGAPQGRMELAETPPSPPPRQQRFSSLLVLQVRGAGRPGRQDPQTHSPTTLAPWLTQGTDFAALPPSSARAPHPPSRGIRVTVRVGLAPGITAGVGGCESKCAQMGIAHSPRGSCRGGTHVLSLWVICEPPAWAERPCPHCHLWEPTRPPRIPEQARPSGWAGGRSGSRRASRVRGSDEPG